MQTKNLKKKGFTLVELVIVVAVIAVLSAILIPTIGCFVEQAKETNDMATVRLLNVALVEDGAENDVPETMTEVLAAMNRKGYDIEKLNPRSTGEILWDSVNNRFLLRKDNKDLYRDNNSKATTDADLWKIVETVNENGTTKTDTDITADLSDGYSHYLKGEYFTSNSLTITTGLDVGENISIKSISYNGTNNATIRTNSFDTILTVNTGANVAHYGDLGELVVEKVAMSSYHEYGNVRVATLTEGNLEVMNGASINVVKVTATDGTKAKVKVDGAVNTLVASDDITVSGTNAPEKTTVTGDISNAVAIVDGEAKTTIETTDFVGNTAIVLKDLTDKEYTLENCTIVGNMVELNGVVSGSADVTLQNIYTTSVTVAQGFSGTLTFDGGKLKNTSQKEAFIASSKTSTPNASYVFKNMTVEASTLKGIKIQSAKSVVIENCEFDGSKLNGTSGDDISQTRSLSAIDITIEDSSIVKVDIKITDCIFKNIPYGDGSPYDTAGAIKIKDQQGGKIGTVVIENNKFINCCRDIVIGKAQESDNRDLHGKTFDVNSSAKWTVRNNISTATAESIKSIDVKTYFDQTTLKTKIGKMVGGCAVFDVADAYDDSNIHSVQFN